MDKFSRVLSSKTNGYLAKIPFQTGPITKAPSETIWLTVTVNFTGRTESNTQGNGKWDFRKVLESRHLPTGNS